MWFLDSSLIVQTGLRVFQDGLLILSCNENDYEAFQLDWSSVNSIVLVVRSLHLMISLFCMFCGVCCLPTVLREDVIVRDDVLRCALQRGRAA